MLQVCISLNDLSVLCYVRFDICAGVHYNESVIFEQDSVFSCLVLGIEDRIFCPYVFFRVLDRLSGPVRLCIPAYQPGCVLLRNFIRSL